MVFVKKKGIFYHLCFLGKSIQKRSFFDILDKKECSLDQKKEVLKSPNNLPPIFWGKSTGDEVGNFPQVHGFCQKNRTFYRLDLLGKSTQKRSFFDILDEKECFLDQKKEVLKKSKTIEIFHRFSLCQKIELFIIGVFWANQARKDRSFYIFWIKKNAF